MKLFDDGRSARIAVAGSGYISAGLVRVLSSFEDITVTAVLTHRDPHRDHEYTHPDLLVREPSQLVNDCDLIVECSGTVSRAMLAVDAAFAAGLPVVTVNAEFQVTAGHLYAGRGLLTEAEGDQPGALAALTEEITLMGFEPLVYGNVKTFLDPNPTPDAMRHQAAGHGISQQQVTSFTDGTKLHVELALVANGLGATITTGGPRGLHGPDLASCITALAAVAAQHGAPISDYCMPEHTDRHVFITASHPSPDTNELAHYKLGPGPLYTFTRDRHLGHYEVPRTIRRVLTTGKPLLTNGSTPTATVAAVAKTNVPAGTRLKSAIGSDLFRGIALPTADHPGLVSIGLLENATISRALQAGAHVTANDVRLDDTLAAQLAEHATAGTAR